jgi:hypothetical protein
MTTAEIEMLCNTFIIVVIIWAVTKFLTSK